MTAATTELSEAAERLIPALDALPESDRTKLAQRLLASLDAQYEEPAEVQAAWKAELRRRVEEIKSGKVTGVPAEEVDRRMREKYR